MKPTLLFSDYDLHSVLENQKSEVRDKASQVIADRLFEDDFDRVVYEVAEDLRIDPIQLDTEATTFEQKEAQVDVSRDPMRYFVDRSRPFYVDGIKVTYFVPFSGDPELFKCRPNTFTTNPPYAIIRSNELVFEFSVTDGNVLVTKERFTKELNNVQQWLGFVESQLADYNGSLANAVRPHLENRRQLLEKSRAQFDDLGFKPRQSPPVLENASVVSNISKGSNRPQKARTKESGRTVASETRKYDVALSFAGENREYVDRVANHLKNAEVQVFYDLFEKVDLWGKNLIDHLGKVYSQQSRFIVMFISEHYALKSWPNHERKSAQDRAVKMQEDCILPVRFDDSEIPGMPGSIGFIDARETGPEVLASLIIEKIRSV